MYRIVNIQRFQSVSRKSYNIISQAALSSTTASQSKVTREFTHFDNFELKDGVAIVRFNCPGKVNTLSHDMFQDGEKIFRDYIMSNKDVKAVVFISSKPDNFIAGADIDMIEKVQDKAELKKGTMQVHQLFKEMKKTNIPLVAAINGSCLGGGLEWALYCDYRIATTSKKTSLGLPEVMLGLLPGMGGTYHVPKLCGYPTALEMILTGKNLRPEKAKKVGLVDLLVDPAALENVAIQQALGLANGTVKKAHRKKDMMARVLEDTPIGRYFMFKKAKEGVDKNTNGKYPAPYKILDVLEKNYGASMESHLEYEANSFVELAKTKESEALIGIFKGTKAVKKHDYGEPKHEVKNIAVLGAGLMGAGIAQVSVDNGKYRVLLKDRDMPSVSKGQDAIKTALEGKLKKKRITNYEFASTNSRVVPLHDGVESWKRHFASADLVIEAVFEDIAVKHKVLQEMEAIIPKHAIFASNTSAIPIAQIAAGAKIPERVIGMHYFSPVPMMPLLEIIQHPTTAPEVAAAAMEVGSRQGKTPIFVKDVPGFFVNRCLSPYSVEVSALIQEGVPIDVMDKSLKDFGMPIGPMTLSDEVGIDVSYKVGKFMQGADLGVRMAGGDPSLIAIMIEKGFLGRKSGKGFYLYPKDAKKGAKKELNPEVTSYLKEHLAKKGINGPVNIPVEEIQWRTVSRFINEAAFCLQDGIIRNPYDGKLIIC